MRVAPELGHWIGTDRHDSTHYDHRLRAGPAVSLAV